MKGDMTGDGWSVSKKKNLSRQTRRRYETDLRDDEGVEHEKTDGTAGG